jgi:hypothetical protein
MGIPKGRLSFINKPLQVSNNKTKPFSSTKHSYFQKTKMQKFHEREYLCLGCSPLLQPHIKYRRRRWHLRNLLLLSLAPVVQKVKNEDRGMKEWFSVSDARLIFIWRENESGNGDA